MYTELHYTKIHSASSTSMPVITILCPYSTCKRLHGVIADRSSHFYHVQRPII